MTTEPTPVSPKVIASTVASALATIIWIVAALIWEDTFTETQMAALVGASTTVLTFLIGFLIADPLRRRGATAPVDPTSPGTSL